MTVSKIYRRFFGVKSLRPDEVGEALMYYGFVASNPFRSDADELVVQDLLVALRDAGEDPGWEPVERESLDDALSENL